MRFQKITHPALLKLARLPPKGKPKPGDMKYGFALLMVLGGWISGWTALAQKGPQIELRVSDRSGAPVPGAVVRSLDRHQAGFADAEGWVSWASEGAATERIEVSAPGYRKKAVELSPGTKSLEIVLEADPAQLADVVVTASLSEQRRSETSVSISVLKPYVLDNRGSLNVENTLEQLPGLNIADGQANVRSGSGWSYGAGTRVQVLLNDLPLISPDAGQVQWDLLPFESASQIEVLKGAASSLYGSSALNGVIHLRTELPSVEPQAMVQLGSSVYGAPARSDYQWWESARTTQSARFGFSSGQSKVAYRFSGLLMNDRGYRFDEPDARARLFAQTQIQSTRIKGLAYGLDGGLMWSKTGDALLWNSRSTPYVALDSSVTQTTGADVFLDPHATYVQGANTHKVRLRYLRVDNNAANRTTDFANRSDQWMGQYTYRRSFNQGWVVQSGLFGSMSESNSELFQGRHEASNLALFAQVEKDFGRLKLVGGFRWEEVRMDEDRYSRPLVRFGLNHRFGHATYARASVGEGFRFPSMAERYTLTNVGAIFVLPSPQLKPEEGVSAEIGLRQELPLGDKGLYVDVAAYWMRYENMLEFQFAQWESTPQNPVGLGFRSVNTGPTQISGVEIELGGEARWGAVDLRFLAGFNWAQPVALEPNLIYATDSNGNEMSYLNTSSDTTDHILKYRYERLYRLDVEAHWRQWTLGAGMRGNGFMRNIDGIFESPLVEILIPGVGIKESRLEQKAEGDDLVFDVRLLYAFNAHWMGGITVDNLTNEEVQPRPAQLGPPRRFNVLLRWTL